MSLFRSSPNHTSIGLTILRIATAAVFINHGYQKLFVFGISGVSGAFGHMGIPLPGITGPLIGILEFFGGIALILGLLTRLVAFGFVCDMFGAIFFVLFKNGFSHFELEFLLLAASAALAFAGAGRFSVDEVIAGRRDGGRVTAQP
jgi:putative oxidoreductase